MADEPTIKASHSTSARNKDGGLRRLIWKNKWKTFVPPAVIVFLLSIFNSGISAVVSDIAVEGPGKAVKNIFLKDEGLSIDLISSAAAPFQTETSLELRHLVSFELSASDLFKDLTVSAVFAEGTDVVQSHVLYSNGANGFTPELKAEGRMLLHLHESLHPKLQAKIYFRTLRQATSREDIEAQLPQIEVHAKDARGVDRVFTF